MAFPSLGECRQCQGALCVSGNEVVCETCGLAVPDHPLVKEAAERAKNAKPRIWREPKADDFVKPPAEQRIEALEKSNAALQRRVANLEDRQKPPLKMAK